MPNDADVIDRPVTTTQPKNKIKPEQPRLYDVLLHNDNTTMPDFVCDMLARHFNMNAERAFMVMKTAHMEGLCLVTKLAKDIAETKVERANAESRATKHPFLNKPIELTFSCQPE